MDGKGGHCPPGEGEVARESAEQPAAGVAAKIVGKAKEEMGGWTLQPDVQALHC